MNAGPVSERVYDTLRRLILEHGFRPGDKLDPNLLAEHLSASITPVREALNVLTGEQLVETHRAGGYYIPALDEPTLKDMYAWANQIAALALRLWRPWCTIDWDRIEDKKTAYADRVADVMSGTTRGSVNGEHGRAMTLLNARLHAVRVVESTVFPDGLEELVALELALDSGDRDTLRRGLNAYHRRRVRSAASLVRASYRSAAPGAPTIGL
ncbi:MAG: hypothetical protein RIS94_1554 [Pseudomonadota bacterium]|jgi:DNA-binding transcriptional regulator YhcF (GntR family)